MILYLIKYKQMSKQLNNLNINNGGVCYSKKNNLLINLSVVKVRILLFFMLGAQLGFTQEVTVYHTKEEYDHLKYINAFDIYKKVLDSGVKDPELFRRLAGASYFNRDFKKASEWYKKYYESSNVKPSLVDNYRYGQVLKSLDQHQLADSLLTTYYDSKGLRYIGESQVKKDEKTIDNYGVFTVTDFALNTDLSEYPVFIGRGKVYVAGQHLNAKKRSKTASDIFILDSTSNKFKPIKGDINSPFNEGPLTITNDGKTLFFTRNDYYKSRLRKNKDGIVTLNIYIASYKDGEWKNIKPFPYNHEEYSVGHPALSADNRTLFFISNKPGGKGGSDLYRVSYFEDGSFGEPKNMTVLNTVGNEMFPFIDKKTNILYFSSNEAGTMGGLDIYIAKLNNEGIYKRAYNIGEPVNSTYDDFAFMINEEGVGYFASNRVSEVGSDDIYKVQKEREFEVPEYVIIGGKVIDQKEGVPIENAGVVLYGEDNKQLGQTETGFDGYYQFAEQNIKLISYIKAHKESYQAIEKDLDSNERVVDFALKKAIPEIIGVGGQLKDKKTGEGISNGVISLLDINGDVIDSVTSDANGNYEFQNVKTNQLAFLRVEKEDYQTEEYEVDLEKIRDGEVKEDISLVKSRVALALGSDVASILNPIYFDYSESYIREDAKIELAKIVEVLKKYPKLSIKVESHTDSKGKAITNLKLSEKRARATYNYLIEQGVDPRRMIYKGYGETQLLNKCKDGKTCSEEEHQLNRRSTFKIIEIK